MPVASFRPGLIIKVWSIIFLMTEVVESFNFLMIVVDDLRPALGCYGDTKAYTPNIDKLTENGVLFTRAYAQQALCAPSRNSFLTSRRPDSLRLYDFYSYWRDTAGNFTTLPQHLKAHGYRTKSIGKVFHPGISSNNSDDCPYSWTDTPFHPRTNRYKDWPVCSTSNESIPAANLVCPVSVASMPGGTLPDLEILKAARRFLKNQASDSRPFLLAVGFQKPHIPLKYPREYLRYHPLSKFHIIGPYEWPKNVSDVAYNPWTDIRRRDDVRNLRLAFPWEKIPEDFAETIVQSYYAAVTYVDDLIGALLDELRDSNFRDDTVVVLTSDHGWSLGEHAEWAKYSNFDVALRVPLIISIPRTGPRVTITNVGRSGFLYPTTTKTRGARHEVRGETHRSAHPRRRENWKYSKCREDPRRSEYRIFKDERNVTRLDALVELVDIFPTIAELAGFPIPVCPDPEAQCSDHVEIDTASVNSCSEGTSLLPLVKAAVENEVIAWKNAAFGQYPRPGLEPTSKPNSDEPRLRDITVMGYTLRTGRYRYTAWLPFVQETRTPDWRTILAEELYEHEVDPGENSNLARNPDFYDVKEELRRLLRRGWRDALPEANEARV